MARGLTPFGRDAVEEMQRLGMLVDVSHLSDGGFWEVARLAKRPFLASHSNCRALCPHPRNLTDEMLRTLGEKGGVAGLNFGPQFLNADPEIGAAPPLPSHARPPHGGQGRQSTAWPWAPISTGLPANLRSAALRTWRCWPMPCTRRDFRRIRSGRSSLTTPPGLSGRA